MTKTVKVITGVLGFLMLMAGSAKFTEPFNFFIYKQLSLSGFPFPEIMQYVVKMSEVGLGLALLYITFMGGRLSAGLRNKIFNLCHLTVAIMMIVAIYVHLHPNVPAEILPMEIKPPFMPIFFLLIISANFFLYRKRSVKS